MRPICFSGLWSHFHHLASGSSVTMQESVSSATSTSSAGVDQEINFHLAQTVLTLQQ